MSGITITPGQVVVQHASGTSTITEQDCLGKVAQVLQSQGFFEVQLQEGSVSFQIEGAHYTANPTFSGAIQTYCGRQGFGVSAQDSGRGSRKTRRYEVLQ